MKKGLLIFWFTIISVNGFSDTLDYWQVYYNDSLILNFNSISQNLSLQLIETKIEENDTISIRYGKDTHCSNCTFILFVRDEKKRKLRLKETKEFYGKLSISLNRLITFGQKNKNKRYDFYYYERNINGRNSPIIPILRLTLK